MRATLLVLALAVALALPAPTHAASVPRVDDPTGLVLRADDDGARELMGAVEDGQGGSFSYTPERTPAQVPDAREAGVFTHAWTSASGAPMTTLGTYVISQSNGLVRQPLLILENGGTADVEAAALWLAANDSIAHATDLEPYLLELLMPEFQNAFAGDPSDSSTYVTYPTLYAWTLHRATPAGELWSGAYLLREGSVAASPFHAEKVAEIGVAARVDAVTTRVAGAYVKDAIDSAEPGAASDLVTVGAVAHDARAPLASLRATDARVGPDPVAHPGAQQDTLALGATLPDGSFVPLVGARTTASYARTGAGYDYTRITALGAFAQGAFVPLAGFRYHSDAGDANDLARVTVQGGLGADGAGNDEADVGAFVGDAYQPLVGAVHRTSFVGMAHSHASLVAVGAYGPTGFEGVLAASYDGTAPLLRWAIDAADGTDGSDGWRVATGALVAGDYEAVLGFDVGPNAPRGVAPAQRDITLGAFVVDYRGWTPVASLDYDGSSAPSVFAVDFALGGTLGSRSGDFDLRAGAWVLGTQYVPLAGVQWRDAPVDGGAENGTTLVAGAYAPDGSFVPLAGAAYWGDGSLVDAIGDPTNTRDDRPANVAVGVFAQGAFVPLATVHNDGSGTSVTVGPALRP